LAYSAAEHVALLDCISNVADSFNALESSEERKEAFTKMVASFYIPASVAT
jgi:hypothetical protein